MNEFTIEARGPFSFAQSLDVMCHWAPVTRFAARDGTVRMSFLLDGTLAPVAVALRAHERGLSGFAVGTKDLDAVSRQVARIFSLDHDATRYPELGERDPAIGRLMAALPGLRPVNFPSPYEAAAWAILSQRVSMAQAARMRERILEAHGVPLRVAGETIRCFPPPERLLRLTVAPEEKRARLHALADHVALLDADRLRALGDVAGPESLRAIRGIGPFWSQGIYLRACGIRDRFPEEPIARAALAKLGGDPETYKPFRMWICFLLRVADARGLLQPTRRRRSATATPRRMKTNGSAPAAAPGAAEQP